MKSQRTMSFIKNIFVIPGQSLRMCILFCHLLLILSNCYVFALQNTGGDEPFSPNLLDNQVCSEIFETNPCAKDILKLFVDQINENKNEIKLLKEKLESLNRSDKISLKTRFQEDHFDENTDVRLLKSKVDEFDLHTDFDLTHKHKIDNHIQDEKIEDNGNPIYNPLKKEKTGSSDNSLHDKENKISYWKIIGNVLDEHLKNTENAYNNDESVGSNRGFSKQRFPYSYDRFYQSNQDQNEAIVNQSENFSKKTVINDRKWSWSNLGNFVLKSIKWSRLGEQIDGYFDISNRQLDLGILTPSLTSVVLPAASLGLGGFNLVQNTMQQEAIDDRTETLDDLKVAIGALSERIAYLEPASQYATAAIISDLEVKVENVISSQSDFCDAFEKISQDLQAHIALEGIAGQAGGHTVGTANDALNSDDQMHCCVNNSNGKMFCDTKSRLDLFSSLKWYSYSEPRICDRCSTGTANDPGSCDTYDTDFPNNLCKSD